MSSRPIDDWNGAYRSYDLLAEIAGAVAVVLALTIALALLFGAPQRAAVTFREWAGQDPVDFVTTTLDELTAQSETAQYGPPYDANGDAAQSMLGVSPQRLAGVRIPVDTAQDLVLRPLGRLAADGSDLATALNRFQSAGPSQRTAWTDAYRTRLASGSIPDPATVTDAGPVPVLMQAMLSLADSGAIDAALIDDVPDGPGFFVMDYTRSQLYLADGSYLAGVGAADGLAGDEWGMAATIGNWPGQVWLLPVSFWYQFPPGSTSDNGDLIVLSIVGVLGLALVLVPFIPGLRDLPHRIGAYKLIWRRYYADLDGGPPAPMASLERTASSTGPPL